MSRYRSLLPPTLDEVFTVASALELGMSPAELRAQRFRRVYHGLRSVKSDDFAASGATELALRAALDFAPKLRPGEAFSHDTALMLHGCPIRVPTTTHVISPAGTTRHRRVGVTGHAYSAPMSVSAINGLPVASQLDALSQSASSLPLIELIIAADALLLPRGRFRDLPAKIDASQVVCRADAFSSRGARDLRRAIAHARVGAESRMETLTRLVLAAYGLDHFFSLQVDLTDDAGWIGRFDLVDTVNKIIVEYDGEQHRLDRSQYLKDVRRLDRARACGYRVIRVHAEELLREPEELAMRVASLLKVRLHSQPHRMLLPRP